jgi:uncharacterized membrane protein YheB (UPF0754 family)
MVMKAKALAFERLGLTCDYQAAEQLRRRWMEVREAYLHSLRNLCSKLNVRVEITSESQAERIIENAMATKIRHLQQQLLEQDPEAQLVVQLNKHRQSFEDLLHTRAETEEIEARWQQMLQLISRYESKTDCVFTTPDGEPIQ